MPDSLLKLQSITDFREYMITLFSDEHLKYLIDNKINTSNTNFNIYFAICSQLYLPTEITFKDKNIFIGLNTFVSLSAKQLT